jgi:hypothetical protein
MSAACMPLTHSRAQACIDTLRPLKTARQSVLGAAKDPVPGAPPVSNEFTKTQLGSAVPDAVLAPGAPRFVVCNRTAFKCVSARPATGGGDCEPVRGVRTPRAGSAFARLWDTRGRSSRERANAGGALAVRAPVSAFTPAPARAYQRGRRRSTRRWWSTPRCGRTTRLAWRRCRTGSGWRGTATVEACSALKTARATLPCASRGCGTSTRSFRRRLRGRQARHQGHQGHHLPPRAERMTDANA